MNANAPFLPTVTVLGNRVVSVGGVVSGGGGSVTSLAPWIRLANVDGATSRQSANGSPAASSATTGGSAVSTGEDTVCPGVHMPPARTATTARGNADQEANAR